MNNKVFLSMALVSSIGLVGCSESDDPAALVKAVKLESQRAKGTIIETLAFGGNGIRLRPEQTHQLIAMGTDSNGDVRDVTKEVSWSSSNTDIATIDENGLVTAIASLDDNRGLVEFTATTINDISAVTELSVSDNAASSLEVVLFEQEGETLTTCIDTQMAAIITYQDGYISAPDTNHLSWQLTGSSSAQIDTAGVVYTSAAATEILNIVATHADGVLGAGDFRASIALLDSISIESSEKGDTGLILDLTERTNLVSQLTLSNDEIYQITNSTTWASSIDSVAAVSNDVGVKGNIVGLKAGETSILASCGGQQAQLSTTIVGDSTLNDLKINSGQESLELEPGERASLQLLADLVGVNGDFNVSEFAQWSLSGTDLATYELQGLGTSEANLALTAVSDKTGSFTLVSSYDGKTRTLDITVSE